MKELICPERLRGTIEMAEATAEREGLLPMITFDLLYDIIDKIPKLPAVPAAPDTVQVTRCKDCRYGSIEGNEGDEFVKCMCNDTIVYELNDYCSLAERRKENE